MRLGKGNASGSRECLLVRCCLRVLLLIARVAIVRKACQASADALVVAASNLVWWLDVLVTVECTALANCVSALFLRGASSSSPSCALQSQRSFRRRVCSSWTFPLPAGGAIRLGLRFSSG